jgi:predicted metal-dependent RNase
MTNKNTHNEIVIDDAQITELIEQYRNTDSRKKQRELENQVLQETVWKASPETTEPQPTLDQDQIETVYQELPEDAQEAKRILRSLLFQTDKRF